MTMIIADNCVVSIHYTLTDDEGTVIDSSEGGDCLMYLHGARNIIPGLENALSGKQSGDSLSVSVVPAEGYGEFNPQLVQVVPIDAFAGVEEIEPGMQFQAQTPSGIQVITVTHVDGGEVTVDANHPLAGKTLHFAVSIEEVREATEQELAHGHVHAGGHDH